MIYDNLIKSMVIKHALIQRMNRMASFITKNE